MTIHFHRELEKLKRMILSLGAMVEDRVRKASKAVDMIDADLAQEIINTDIEIDEMEVEVEEECLKAMALYQPVAVDLRFLVAVIKINNELERIGDQAVNIAERVLVIAKQSRHEYLFDYSSMSCKAENMLKMSLDALVNLDVELALKVCAMDDEVDKIKKKAYDKIKKGMREYPNHLGYMINLLLVSRHLERLADHTTNIAEEVIYMIKGDIIRHGRIKEKAGKYGKS
ncbi:MAG: phosphate signaling complex protein PhoU [Deltaproteobacteria bacterium]|nr:phosphate signaling complex protein PhoU [Deltaproteobacteria bacterium]